MNPSNPRSVAIPAGREVLKRIDGYLERGEDFAVETTLSSHASIVLIENARSRGYETRLIFVALQSPEKNTERVRMRSSQGGHFIPDVDVRRRYDRSLANLSAALRSVNFAKVYDNSGAAHRLVLVVENGNVIHRSPDPPHWLVGRFD